MKDYLTRAQVAQHTSIAPQTLANWATLGKGPKFVKLPNGLVRYRPEDVEAWIEGIEEAA